MSDSERIAYLELQVGALWELLYDARRQAGCPERDCEPIPSGRGWARYIEHLQKRISEMDRVFSEHQK